MTPYYSDPLVTLHLGDCLEVMPGLEAESVDAICTDPPYGISFMGRRWDHGVPAEPFWAEMYRVAKPGAYLLAFGGTRTVHRIATNIEDAGWIIRDMLMWIYASGFPKGKANLKPAHEPIVLARKPGPLRPLAIDECRIDSPDVNLEAVQRQTDPSMFQGNGGNVQPTYNPSGRWPSNVLLSDPELFDEPNPGIVGSGATARSSGEYEAVIRGDRNGPASIPLDNGPQYGDSGGYSRFFIIPKAPRTERTVNGKRGTHPTQKPVDLMRHLLKLVTPPGGVALDPFAGSGTTGVAASLEGIRSILIERESEYAEQAKGRLMATPMGLGLSTELKQLPRKQVDGIAVQRNKTGEGYAASAYEIKQGPGPDMGYGRRKPKPESLAPKPGMFDEEPAA